MIWIYWAAVHGPAELDTAEHTSDSCWMMVFTKKKLNRFIYSILKYNLYSTETS